MAEYGIQLKSGAITMVRGKEGPWSIEHQVESMKGIIGDCLETAQSVLDWLAENKGEHNIYVIWRDGDNLYPCELYLGENAIEIIPIDARITAPDQIELNEDDNSQPVELEIYVFTPEEK